MHRAFCLSVWSLVSGVWQWQWQCPAVRQFSHLHKNDVHVTVMGFHDDPSYAYLPIHRVKFLSLTHSFLFFFFHFIRISSATAGNPWINYMRTSVTCPSLYTPQSFLFSGHRARLIDRAYLETFEKCMYAEMKLGVVWGQIRLSSLQLYLSS